MAADPLAALAVTAAIGTLGLVFGQPWLFASLGPTVLVQIEYPEHVSARPYNTLVGHGVAAAVAYALVLVTGAAADPPATDRLTVARVVAASIALGLTIAATRALRASHPPAASTTLLVALGLFSVTIDAALTIAAGVVLVVLLGGGLRELRQRTSPLRDPSDAPAAGGPASPG